MLTIEEIIRLLGLEPLPQEGGFFRETYRSPVRVSAPGFDSDRSLRSAIYYLVTPDSHSSLHRLKSDEVFHFYLGDPCTMLQLHPDGTSERFQIGVNLSAGERPQVVAPAGSWQGTCLSEGGSFALIGTSVSPAFEWEDFELGDREKLLAVYPSERELILKLT